jgi:hypothetical protein
MQHLNVVEYILASSYYKRKEYFSVTRLEDKEYLNGIE